MFLLILLLLDCLLLGVIVLLQAGKGGGLAAMGGGVTATEGILGGRQANVVLTRATWTTATIFMVLALILSIMSSRSAQPESILQQDLQEQPAAPTPILPGLNQEPGTQGATPPPGEGAPEIP